MKTLNLLLASSVCSLLFACGGDNANSKTILTVTSSSSVASSVAVSSSSSSAAVSSSSVAVSSSSVAVSSSSVAVSSSSVAVSSSSAAAVVVPTPVAEWKFEDLDYSSSGLISSATTGLGSTDPLKASSTSGKDTFTSVVAGKLGKAVSMNPSPATLVNYPIIKTGTFDYGLGGSGVAFEMWIKPSALPASNTAKSVTLVVNAALTSSIPAGCTFNDGASYSLKLGYDGILTFALNKDAATGGTAVTTTPIVINNWYHIVATYNKTDMRIYINGALDGAAVAYTENVVSAVKTPATADGSYAACAQFKTFGTTTSQSADTGNFQGTVDEFRLYNVGLSAAQVNKRYLQF